MTARRWIAPIVLLALGFACRTTQTAFRGIGVPKPPVFEAPPQFTQEPLPPQFFPPRGQDPAPPFTQPTQPTPANPNPPPTPTNPTNPTQPTLPGSTVVPPRTPDCITGARLAPGDYDYRAHIKFHKTHTSSFTQSNGGSSFYQDIMVHAPIVNGKPDRHLNMDIAVNAHETLHFYAHSYGTGIFDNKGYHFIYDENGQGVRVERFPTQKSQVASLVPDEIRRITSSSSSSQSPIGFSNIAFPVYLINSWHKVAGHLFEEWVCYEGDFRVVYELTKAGYTGKIEQSLNLAAMIYFGTIAMYVTKQNYPQYFNLEASPGNATDYHQIKAAYAMLVEKSVCWLGKAETYASKIRNLGLERYLLNHLRTSSDAAKFRAFLKETYGPVWTNRVLQF